MNARHLPSVLHLYLIQDSRRISAAGTNGLQPLEPFAPRAEEPQGKPAAHLPFPPAQPAGKKKGPCKHEPYYQPKKAPALREPSVTYVIYYELATFRRLAP